MSWSPNRLLAGSLFETKRTGDPANPWRNDNAPPKLLFPAVLAGSNPRLTMDGFLTLETSPAGFGATSTGSPQYPISGAKDGKSKMIFAGSGRTRTGFHSSQISGAAALCAPLPARPLGTIAR